VLGALSWMNNKWNVIPGKHALACFVGAAIMGIGGQHITKFLAGQNPKESYEKYFGKDSTLMQYHGCIKSSDLEHMPDMKNWDKFSKEERSKLAANDWKKVISTAIPTVLAMIGTAAGSIVWAKSKLSNYSDKKIEEMPENTLGYIRKTQSLTGDATRLLSSFLGNTGIGSFRLGSGPILSLMFGSKTGKHNGVPILAQIMHGDFWDAEFNDSAGDIVKLIIKELAGGKTDQQLRDNGYMKRAVRGLERQIFGRSMVTDETVHQLMEAMLTVRRDIQRSHADKPLTPADLSKELTKAIYIDFDELIARKVSTLDLRKVDIREAGLGGLIGRICGALLGQNKQIDNLSKEYHRKVDKLYSNLGRESVSHASGFANAAFA